MQEYIRLEKKYSDCLSVLNRRYNILGILRLIIVIIFFVGFYSYITDPAPVKIFFLFLMVILFLIIIKIHLNIAGHLRITETLLNINRDEITFLKHEGIPFADGSEFKDTNHLCAYDLDFFGSQSLFQHLNRTATYPGKKKFAQLLLSLLPGKEIILNQAAIRELSGMTDWRQHLTALGKINNDNKAVYEKLIQWTTGKNETLPKTTLAAAFLSPAVMCIFLFSYLVFKDVLFIKLMNLLVVFNLAVLVSQYKKIKKELVGADKVYKIIQQYALVIDKIGKEKFKSEKLIFLQSKLTAQNTDAGAELKKLSLFFHRMERINDMFISAIFNGFFLYHLHVLNGLLKWKKEFALRIPEWLEVIGETEALSCLANFSYNNPQFAFPALNTRFNIRFGECGHPLIRQEKRICNTADFNTHQFIILTGSNMSGKSTWLRTLGVNMMLAGIGSPVCAADADVHPMPVLASMRLDDSLSENESYFFAEVKRLKNILNALDAGAGFIILDEILKGTNSDDKRGGTLAILKKLISKKATGVLATHDLEICRITGEHPGYMANKCFEADIINDSLVFDYRIREGICKNKTATFLMKQMEII
ncbi:MAG TPA: DNA mismatch repair protein [Bacteroidia bacterium]|nr:DNA mismatch repair protein [Bacteroidia bacterium]